MSLLVLLIILLVGIVVWHISKSLPALGHIIVTIVVIVILLLILFSYVPLGLVAR